MKKTVILLLVLLSLVAMLSSCGGNEIERLNAELVRAKADLEKSNASNANTQSALESTQDELNQVSQNLTNTQSALKSTQDELNQVSQNLTNTQKEKEDMARQRDLIAKEMGNISAQEEQYDTLINVLKAYSENESVDIIRILPEFMVSEQLRGCPWLTHSWTYKMWVLTGKVEAVDKKNETITLEGGWTFKVRSSAILASDNRKYPWYQVFLGEFVDIMLYELPLGAPLPLGVPDRLSVIGIVSPGGMPTYGF